MQQKGKHKLEVLYSKKKSWSHDQTMTLKLAVTIVYLNVEFEKGQPLNLFSVDKSNLCTVATYVESNLLGVEGKHCCSVALPITCWQPRVKRNANLLIKSVNGR